MAGGSLGTQPSPTAGSSIPWGQPSTAASVLLCRVIHHIFQHNSFSLALIHPRKEPGLITALELSVKFTS